MNDIPPALFEPQAVGDIVDRLRGKYPVGPLMPNGEPEFGWRQFPAKFLPPLHFEAADEIEKLRESLGELVALCEMDSECSPPNDLYIVVEVAKQLLSKGRWT